jgi:hypothetical protein
MKKLSLIALVVLVASIAVNAQSSVYTTLNKKCRTIFQQSRPIDSFEAECRGVGGYRVRWVEGDSRESLNIVTPSKHKFEMNFWGLLPSFSSLGGKLEWRVKKGVPFALIARMNTDGDGEKTKSYLVVSKIGRKESCVVDIIEPTAGQNEKARKSADGATAKPCKTEGPGQ